MYKDDDKLIATHLGDDYDKFFGAVVPPIFMNSLHVFPTMESYFNNDKYREFVYGRVSNPTVKIVEEKIAALERGSHGALFSSGMAATTTAISVCCKAGSHIICLDNCYGPVVTYLEDVCIKKLNMTVTYVRGEFAEIEKAIKPETDLMILESPTSLVFDVIDLTKIAALAKAKGVYTYIDNSYCSPLYQKPIEMGIDIVMHTLSKYLGGHSDLIGGVLVCNNQQLGKEILDMRELYGGILGPQEAWLVMRGMRSLAVRLPEHEKTALAVAEFLEAHPAIRKVNYPGLSSNPGHELAKKQQKGSNGLLSFEINGEKEAAVKVCDRLSRFKIGVSWGGFESLVTMPMYKKTDEDAARVGSNRNLIRIHCGLEGVENLIEDLKQALEIVPV